VGEGVEETFRFPQWKAEAFRYTPIILLIIFVALFSHLCYFNVEILK
jgi:hypothetical protein